MYLCRHEAGCDLLSALTEWSGRKYKPGVWQVEVFPSKSENVQCPETTPASLLSFISRSLPALHTLTHIPCPQGWRHTMPQAEAHQALGSLFLCEQMNGDGKYTVQIDFHLCYTTTSPQAEATSWQADRVFNSLTGRVSIPRSRFPAPVFGVLENKVALMVDCFIAECKRQTTGDGP